MLPAKITNKIKFSLLASAIACTLGLIAIPVQAEGQQQGNPTAALPPALRAAVMSGNASAVSQAIAVLSGGDPARAAALASSVIAAAERMLETNPQSAVAIAGAAVATVKNTQVQAGASAQTETVLITAARIFINPAAQQAAPQQAAELASSTMAAASTTNNAALILTIANQTVTAAERISSTNPATAVQLAATATQAVKSQSDTAISSNSSTVLQFATTVGRIIAASGSQQANPTAVANMAIALTTLATNPAVQQVSPSGAIGVLANAYKAATSQTVLSAEPNSTQQVTSILTGSKDNTILRNNDVNWPSEIDRILNTQSSDTNSRVNRETNSNQQNKDQLPQQEQNQRQLASPT